MSFFTNLENEFKAIVQDPLGELTRPLRNPVPISLPSAIPFANQFPSGDSFISIGNPSGDIPDFPFEINLSSGFDNFGQAFQEALFPGTTDTSAGDSARGAVKKIAETIDSPIVREVAGVAAEGLIGIGEATLQPELVAAGLGIKAGLGFTEKAIPVAKAVSQAIQEKDFKKLIGAVKQGNVLLGEVLDEEFLDNQLLGNIENIAGGIQRGIATLQATEEVSHQDQIAQNIVLQKEFEELDNEELTIQKELRGIETELQEQEVELKEIVDSLNPPQSSGDFIESVLEKDSGEDIIKFLDNNIELFLGLPDNQQIQILDIALDTGLIDSLIRNI